MPKAENRDADIRRTAEEIRLQFLNDHAGAGASEFYKMLWRALVNPNLSSTDKVIYALSLAERKNFEWSNDRMGKLANVGALRFNVLSAISKHTALWSHDIEARVAPHTAIFPCPKLSRSRGKSKKKLRRKPAKKPAQGQSFENPEQSKMIVLNSQKRLTTSKDYTSEDSRPSPLRRHGASFKGAEMKKKMDGITQPQVGYSPRTRIDGKAPL